MSGYDAETLIGLVRQYECLYNITSGSNKNRQAKDRAWVEIGHALNINPEECEKKWRNLRDTYTRHRNMEKRKVRSGAGASQRKRYYLMESLSFLAEYDSQGSRERSSKVEPLPREAQTSDSSTYLDERCNSPLVILDEGTRQTPIRQPPSIMQLNRGRRGSSSSSRGSSSRGSSSDSLRYRKAAPRQRTSELDVIEKLLLVALRTEEKKSDDEHFLLSLVGSMERMTERQKIDFKLMIFKHLLQTMSDVENQ